MKKTLRRAFAAALAACLLSGMCAAVSAADFKYPSAYWPLHEAWDAATAAQDPDRIISVAQQTYELLDPLGLGSDVCYNLEPKCNQASWCSEMNGDIAGAIQWLERQRTYAGWLDRNEHSYQDTLLAIDARMEYLEAARDSGIYVLTDQAGNSYPGSGAPASGTLYGSPVTGSQSGESAVLMYVTFGDSYSVQYWIDYYRNNSPKFAQAAQGGVIELAWNFPSESTAGAQAVLDAGSYIEESLQAMGSLNATVLLRLGAEMNCWSECDPAVFIQAFQKVSQAARKYGNIKMVFSPNDISNRNVTFEDYYPGDQYVDWIGVSTYHNTNYSGSVPAYVLGAETYGDDAYYGVGLYDRDPLVVLRPLAAFAQSHNKPMMISECGFSCRGESGGDQTAYALGQMNWFYSYVNMIYPQVKAVFYFDHTLQGSAYAYALSGSSASAYRSAIAGNGAYLAQGQTSGKTWKPLSAVSAAKETLKLAVYASFPGKDPISVTYYVDGQAVKTSSSAPFYFELDPSALSSGKHTVQAKSASGKFTSATPVYEISVSNPDQVFSDVAPGDWFAPYVKTVYEKGLFTGNADGTFAPRSNMKYVEFFVVLRQFSGDTVTAVEGAPWYQGYVNWAAGRGLIPEAVQENFDPTAFITRQDMAAIFGAFLDVFQVSAPAVNSGEASYADQGSIADYAAAGVAECYRAGIMSGSGGSFNPLNTATRAEVAVTMVNLAKIMGK